MTDKKAMHAEIVPCQNCEASIYMLNQSGSVFVIDAKPIKKMISVGSIKPREPNEIGYAILDRDDPVYALRWVFVEHHCHSTRHSVEADKKESDD